jgi:chemotaxis protein MotA
MFAIIGIVVVFGAIIAGYLMEHGNLKVLMQPAELVIIGGAALGTVLIGNPLHIIKQMVSGVVGVFGGSKLSRWQAAMTRSSASTLSRTSATVWLEGKRVM